MFSIVAYAYILIEMFLPNRCDRNKYPEIHDFLVNDIIPIVRGILVIVYRNHIKPMWFIAVIMIKQTGTILL